MSFPKTNFFTSIKNLKIISLVFLMFLMIYLFSFYVQNYKALESTNGSLVLIVISVSVFVFMSLVIYFLWRLEKILGAPLSNVLKYTEQMGRNDFNQELNITNDNQNSVVGWLS